MITKQQINFTSYKQNNKPEKLKPIHNLLINTISLLKISKAAYKLNYLNKMMNFIRIISLYTLKNNPHLKISELHLSEKPDTNFSERIYRSFIELLIHFDIIIINNTETKLNPAYKHLYQSNKLNQIIEQGDCAYNSNNTKANKLVKDYYFVCDLIKKYRNENHQFQTIKGKQQSKWHKLIVNRHLDYEIRLSETLQNLKNLKIPNKIISPFTEDYYTESGQNAFKNYTGQRFIKYLQNIKQQTPNIKVFDLGCGYGNYVEIIHNNIEKAHITGIEKNKQVYNTTKIKFENTNRVQIINNDFFSYEPKQKYDTILINYVLFYFNYAQKIQILNKAKTMLNKNGSIILCQYFSGIEALKKDMAKLQKDYTIIKKTEMYYSDKILYANTLWNDVVNTFSESVK